jgi:hypothetical protein
MKEQLKEALDRAEAGRAEAVAARQQLAQERRRCAALQAALERRGGDQAALAEPPAAAARLPGAEPAVAASAAAGLPRMDGIRQLACLQGSALALSKCSLAELYRFEASPALWEFL